MTFVAPESSGWAIVAPLAQVIFHYLNINRFSLPEPPDIQVTGTVSCDHVELAPDLPTNFTLLSNILSTVCSQSRNLKAPPPLLPRVRCLVTSRSRPWVRGVRGRVVWGEDGCCDVTPWPWQGHWSRYTQADTPNKLLFFAWLDYSDSGLTKGKWLWFFFSDTCKCVIRRAFV